MEKIKIFVDSRVEWFVNEMLERKTYIVQFSEQKNIMKPDTIFD